MLDLRALEARYCVADVFLVYKESKIRALWAGGLLSFYAIVDVSTSYQYPLLSVTYRLPGFSIFSKEYYNRSQDCDCGAHSVSTPSTTADTEFLSRYKRVKFRFLHLHILRRIN